MCGDATEFDEIDECIFCASGLHSDMSESVSTDSSHDEIDASVGAVSDSVPVVGMSEESRIPF